MLARESRVVSRVGRGTYVARPREGDDLLVDLVAEPPRAGAVGDPRSAGAPGGRAARRARSTSPPACRWSTPASRPPCRPSWRRSCARRAPRCSATARRAATSACASWSPTHGAVRGLHADPEAILVTTSGQQAIDLAVRALVEPGDVVLCETPTVRRRRRRAGRLAGPHRADPVDAHGLRVDAVAEAIRLERPRLLFANPTGNNATGTVLSDERRARLAALSAETGLVIIEDDTGAELSHDGPVPAPIAAFDPEAPVILVKSYAKTVLPGLRLGVILPPPHLDRRVLAAKLVADRYTSPPLVRALAGLPGPPRGGPATSSARGCCTATAATRSSARSSAGSAAAPRGSPPRAGFNLWLRLPDRVSEEEIFARGVERGVMRLPRAHLRAARRPDVAPAAVVLDDAHRRRPTAASPGSRSPCATRSAAAAATARSRASEPIRWRRASPAVVRAPRRGHRGSRCT